MTNFIKSALILASLLAPVAAFGDAPAKPGAGSGSDAKKPTDTKAQPAKDAPAGTKKPATDVKKPAKDAPTPPPAPTK